MEARSGGPKAAGHDLHDRIAAGRGQGEQRHQPQGAFTRTKHHDDAREADTHSGPAAEAH